MAVYVDALQNEVFVDKVLLSIQAELECKLCPRECGVNRHTSNDGYCQTLGSMSGVPIMEYLVHLGEEKVVSGINGTGAIFFGNCNLDCVFCQNINKLHKKYYNLTEFSTIMLDMQNKGCHSISIISPSHCVGALIGGLYIAAVNGLNIPVLYNSGGYDSTIALELLDGLIDIYMPDMKWSDNDSAKKYSGIDNYVEINRSAVKTMYDQVGDAVIEDGVIQKGLLIRYLILPNRFEDAKKTVIWIKDNIGVDIYISLLTDYYPFDRASEFKDLDRVVTQKEKDDVIGLYVDAGFKNIEY